MPLNQQDQLQLLKDILNNHQVDCCGSVSELEQLERLVKSLMADSNMNNDVLEQIYSYSQNGINSSNLDNHIESHQQQLSQWVNDVETFS
ncbi:YtzH-like family protein [Robertmurraya massiliosenegalensis]|uniref:YtzH-like family protein n=1 Tax=Robertmurraya TaxID=2837507 RepID=UPI0039A60114